MKVHRGLILVLILFWLVLILVFAKYPIYPQYPSADFTQHLNIARDVAAGHFQPFRSQILYEGVEYYLALSIIVCHCESLMAIRYAMGFLAAISPIVIFFSTREIFQDGHKATFASILFVGSGLWYIMVFNVGLYANFFGILAMLMLIWAVLRFVRSNLGVKNSLFVASALLLALFSHYSILFAFLALLAYLSVSITMKREYQKNSFIAMAVLVAPLLIGLIVFPDILNQLLAYTNPSSGIQYNPQGYLATIISIPVLSLIFGVMGFDWATLLMFTFLIAYCIPFKLKRNSKPRLAFASRGLNSLILPVMFASIILLAPSNPTAWRFSLIALLPLSIAPASPLSQLWQKKKDRLTKHRYRPVGRLFLVPILLILLMPNIFAITADALSDTNMTNSYQIQTREAILWMNQQHCIKKNPYPYANLNGSFYYSWEGAARCQYVSVTDWHFAISTYEIGAWATFNATYSTAPNLALYYASRSQVDYLILSNITSYYLPSCAQSLLTLSILNYTSNSATYKIHYFSDQRQDAIVSVWVNGTQKGTGQLENGSLTSKINFTKNGTFDIYAQLGIVKSNTMRIFAGTDKQPQTIELQSDYCQPFNWTTDDFLGRGTLAWSSKNIKIWCVSQFCT